MQTHLQTITVTGKSPFEFLQRIITQDLNQCRQKPMLSAICNHLGKVTHIFWIQAKPTITIWTEEPDLLIKTLSFYDPFSDNHYTISPDHSQPVSTDTTWALFLIQEKIPTLSHKDKNRYTPQMLGLDQHQAISLSKGCFIGHEPIARTQLLGKTKRKITYLTSKTAPDDALSVFFDNEIYHYLCIQSLSA